MTLAAADRDAAVARASAAISEDAVVEIARLLAATPSPPGRERALAQAVAEWGRRANPLVEWEVDALDEESASLVARAGSGRRAGRELVIYGHLDTSLTGEAERDMPVTGESAAAPAFRSDGATRTLRGLGVGVAKGPSAAAIASFLAASAALRPLDAAHGLVCFLAAGGTHRAAPPAAAATRAVPFGRGVRAALERGWRPSAVLNVKGGPPGVLHEEPASAYLRVRLRRTWAAALMRRTAAPDGGLLRHTGPVMDAIEAWRERYLASHPPSGQLACEIAIGAVRGGLPEKADLIPGLLEIFLYAVLPPGEDPSRVARDLAGFLRERLLDLPGRPAVEVDAYAGAPGGRTDPSSEIVRLSREEWAPAGGGSVSGWTGATDGGIFMASGIPAARLGVTVSRDAADPRIEIVSIDDLVAVARAYARIAVRYLAQSGR